MMLTFLEFQMKVFCMEYIFQPLSPFMKFKVMGIAPPESVVIEPISSPLPPLIDRELQLASVN